MTRLIEKSSKTNSDNLDLFGKGNVLFMFPHPDDELSSTALMSRLTRNNRKVYLLYLSSGIPSENEYLPPLKNEYSFNSYKEMRRREFGEALKFLLIPSKFLLSLNYPARKTLFYINTIYLSVEKIILKEKIGTLLSCPYEGAHPDHEVCSYVASAIKSNYKDIVVLEYASYFMVNNKIISGRFMHNRKVESRTIILDEYDKKLKENMARCYLSQFFMLKGIHSSSQLFRVKPYYNYAKLPRTKIYYESWQKLITGRQVLYQIKRSHLL